MKLSFFNLSEISARRICAILFVLTTLSLAPIACADEGWTLFQNNNLGAAASAFRSALAKDPTDLAAAHGLGTILRLETDPASESELTKVVELAPNDVRAWSDWQALTYNSSDFGTTPQLLNRWLSISQNKQAPSALRSSVLEVVAAKESICGNINAARKIWSSLDYVTDWKTVGPFDNVSHSGFDKAFEPETNEIRFGKQLAGKNDIQISWRTLPLVQDFGTCAVGDFLGDKEASVYYSVTTVNSPTNQSATLWYSPTGASKIWINGTLILTDSIYRIHDWTLGDTFAVPVNLKAGINTVLVKSADDTESTARFALRFTDSKGDSPLKFEADPSLATGSVQSSDAAQAVPILVELGENAAPNVQNLEALAELQTNYNDYDGARDTIARATQLSPNDSWLMWEDASILSDADLTDDSRTAREEARTLMPDNVPAQNDYLTDTTTDISDDQKASRLRTLIARHPNSPLLLQTLASVLADQKLAQQGLNALIKAYSVTPGPSIAEAISSAYSDASRNNDQLVFDRSACTKFAGDYNLINDEADVLDSLGKYSEAVDEYNKALEYGDIKPTVLASISGVYSDAHQPERAIASAVEEISYRPLDAKLRLTLGDLYADSGNKQQAIALYNQSLALDPSQSALRDKISVLEKSKTLLSMVTPITAGPLIDSASGTSAASLASLRTILDEGRMVVYPDGATDTHIHSVVKILTHTAALRLSTYPLAIETSTSKVSNLRARLIKSSGKVIYPYVDDESTGVQLPSLDVGDIIDIEYDVTDYQSGALAHDFWASWIFNSPGVDVGISQFSLITPKAMSFVITNHGNVPPVTQYNSGSWTVRQWKLANAPSSNVEPASPGEADVDDWVDISNVPSWSAIVSWYSDLANSARTPDDSIRAKAADLTKGDTTDDARIHHIVAYVRSIRYQSTPFRLSAYIPTDGKDVIRDIYGDCKDKAALLCSLLGSVGIKAEMILLSPRAHGTTEDLPSTRFDHAIARIKTSTGWQWVDATADQMQYGYLPVPDQGVPALIIDPDTTALTTSPVDDSTLVERSNTINLTLKPDGSVTGTLDGDCRGSVAWVMRTIIQSVPTSESNQVLQSLVGSVISGSTSDGGSFGGINSPDSDVTWTVSFHDDSYAASTGTLLIVKLPLAVLVTSDLNMIDGPNPREKAIELGIEHGTTELNVIITSPSGFEPDTLRPSTSITSPFGEADFTYSANNGILTAKVKLRIDPIRIEVNQIPNYIAFLKQIQAECNKQIVIKQGAN